MQIRFFLVAILVCALLIEESDAWWWRRRRTRTSRSRCPSRSGATPYYFGTLKLRCMIKKGKRESVPSRSTWTSFSRRFIYYKGKYFEFHGYSNIKVTISDSRKCSEFIENRSPGFRSLGLAYIERCGKYFRCRFGGGGIDSGPAGFSSISLACIEGCAKNYRCTFGSCGVFRNNCSKFANKISEVLCTTSSYCPAWCRGPCNDVSYGRKR